MLVFGTGLMINRDIRNSLSKGRVNVIKNLDPVETIFYTCVGQCCFGHSSQISLPHGVFQKILALAYVDLAEFVHFPFVSSCVVILSLCTVL